MKLVSMQNGRGNMDERLAAVLADPHAWALFLDIDGTLLKMAPTPDAVSVPPELPEGVRPQ